MTSQDKAKFISIEKIYKDEVLKLTFSPTSSNYNPADISKGTITFIIKSK